MIRSHCSLAKSGFKRADTRSADLANVQSICARMQLSGFGKRMRAQIVQIAVSAFRKQVQRDEEVEVPL